MSSQRTPLYDQHIALGARMVDFATWEMPLSYASIIEEVKAVREDVGIFDVSHMGILRLRGEGTAYALQKLLTNDISDVKVGFGVYSPMCNEKGGTIDDLIAFPITDGEWLLVVNASQTSADKEWISRHVPHSVELHDESRELAIIAIQGPRALACLQPFVSQSLQSMRRNQCTATQFEQTPVLASRSGYTGEDGFEIFIPASDAGRIWNAVVGKGNATPCGLGARDVLRLEAGLCLYGNELDVSISPLEAGIGWTVKFSKEDFIGRQALIEQLENGLHRRLVGLVMRDRSIPRRGYSVMLEGAMNGTVTSGIFSPTLGKGIALALVSANDAEVGMQVSVSIRGSLKPAVVAKTPFYRRK